MLRHIIVTSLVLLIIVFAQAVVLSKVDLASSRPNEGAHETHKWKAGVLDYEVDVLLKSPIFKTDERFLSYFVESNIFNQTRFNYSSAKLQTLVRGLAPAYFHVGGTSGDFVTFQNPCKEEKAKNHGQKIICPQDWVKLNKFCLKTGLELVFSLNLLQRTEDGQWDPTNAERLLDFNNDVAAWGLGNEPNSYPSHANISLSGDQLGRDFNVLRTILKKRSKYLNASILGPEINSVGPMWTTYYLKGFLSSTNATNGTTFHSYYLDGNTATLEDFLDPEVLDRRLPDQMDVMKRAVDEYYGEGAKLMLGETGTAYNGGATNMSDRYVAGFLFLDKLGMSAKMGLDVLMRAALYGSSYTMLDLDNLDPKPDYWSAYVYKYLVNSTVLKAEIVNTNLNEDDRYVRVYAHCTSTGRSGYDAGAVTLIVLNMHKQNSANITLLHELSGQDVDQYLLTPHGPLGMTSLQMELNHHLLAMVNDRTLPELKPVQIKGGRQLVLPPLSYGFYVVNNAMAESCIE